MYVCMRFQKVHRLDDSLRLLLAGLGRAGEEGQALRLQSSAWAAALAETLELLLALAGKAGGRYEALLRRRLGCYVADCV